MVPVEFSVERVEGPGENGEHAYFDEDEKKLYLSNEVDEDTERVILKSAVDAVYALGS